MSLIASIIKKKGIVKCRGFNHVNHIINLEASLSILKMPSCSLSSSTVDDYFIQVTGISKLLKREFVYEGSLWMCPLKWNFNA